MSMPSIDSNFFSQPLPVGQMIDTAWPAALSVVASCQTRRSNGLGRFSTRIRTRRGIGDIAPLNEDGHEAGLAGRVAAHPQRRRLGDRERVPVDRLHAVPGVLIG